MKKLIACSMLLMAATAVQAQDKPRHEVAYSLGFGSAAQKQWDKYCDRVTTSDMNDPEMCGLGVLLPASWQVNLEYSYQLTNHLSVGAVLTNSMSSADKEKDLDNGKIRISIDGFTQTFMPFAKYEWYRSEKYSFRLYSMAGLGIGYMENTSEICHTKMKEFDGDMYYSDRYEPGFKERKHHFAYQFTPIAIETGEVHWHWFCELGYGHKGILSGGVQYRF